MRTSARLPPAAAACLALLLAVPLAHAGLAPYATESGKISLVTNGEWQA